MRCGGFLVGNSTGKQFSFLNPDEKLTSICLTIMLDTVHLSDMDEKPCIFILMLIMDIFTGSKS